MFGRKPNIVEIIADDLGCWAVGYAGNPEIHTPSIDKLASEGIYFVNFFSVSPAGSPALASLLTGRIPSYHGVHDFVTDGNLSPANGGEKFGQTKLVRYLGSLIGYPDILAENGYVCGKCGRWNLGDAVSPQMSHSFWYVHATGNGSFYNAPVVLDGKVSKEKVYINEAVTNQALRFIRENSGNPFYLNVHYTSPHGSWEGHRQPAEYMKLYDECPFNMCPRDFTHPWQVDSVSCVGGPKRLVALSNYYAAVTALDHSVGRILEHLEEHGLRENTLVMFTSDNGINLGHHGVWGGGNGTNPLNLYDTSLKVPTIVSMPDMVPRGRINRALLSHYDWRPTLLNFLNIEDPEAMELPGEHFDEILLGGDIISRNEIMIIAEYGPVRMIRNRNWKYVRRHPEGPDELYYLTMDPGEMIDLVDKTHQKKRLEEMSNAMDMFFEEYSLVGNEGIDCPVSGAGQCGLIAGKKSGKNIFGEPFRWIDAEGNPREKGYRPPDKII